MYSMVLMAALVGGSEAPDFGHRGCRGWGGHGCWGYNGCYGGCWGGYGCSGYGNGCWCNGYGGYGGYGCVGCFASGYQACYSGYTGTGWACYACQGGYFAGWAGAGYGGGMISCHGCYGAYGGCSCYGGSPYHPTPLTYPLPGVPGKEPEKIPAPGKKGDGKDGKPDDEVSNRARLVVELPTDAKLYIDDQPMKTTSARRVFNTPPLEMGQTYYYILRAEVVRDGQTRTETRRVLLRPGQEIRASFTTLDTLPTATAQR